jgi:hypothetical protein
LQFRSLKIVSASLDAADVTVTYASNGQVTTADSASWNSGSTTGTFSFNAPLPDGNYSAILHANGISDIAGNAINRRRGHQLLRFDRRRQP